MSIRQRIRARPKRGLNEAFQLIAVAGTGGGPGHDPVTVVDSGSINLTLTDQEIQADAIFGTSAGTVAEGNHTHAGSGLTHPQVLARGLGA